MQPQMVMYDEEFQQISGVCERLSREANAKIVFLVDKNGQLIASVGATENLDTTSLASLTAGNIAATGGKRNSPSSSTRGRRTTCTSASSAGG